MSRTPIVLPLSYGNLAIVLIELGLVAGIGMWLDPKNGALVACGLFLVLSVLFRRVIAVQHVQAISLVKQQKFREAIKHYEQSVAFFRQHPWIDDYRAITMFSAAGMTYREMGLVGLAFSYGQLGDGKRARAYYEECLRDFPGNPMAEAALRLMNAASQVEASPLPLPEKN